MKKSLKNVAVLFSLLFTLVLTGPVTTVTDIAEDDNCGISTCRVISDIEDDNSVEH